jgi:hypothetical protein
LPEKARCFIGEINKKLVFDTESLKNSESQPDVDEDLSAFANSYQINENFQLCCQSEATSIFANEVRKLKDFVLDEIDCHPDLYLNKETFLKSINLIDIVSADSTRSNCFTKKYYSADISLKFHLK